MAGRPDPRSDAAPRTLTEDLRARDDAELASLFAVRPDLLHPVPADLPGLSARATTTVSTTRALDALDRWTLQVAEVLAAGPDPMSGDDVVAAVPQVDRQDVDAALARLRERALLWGDRYAWHLVRAVRESFGAWPCGLGPAMASRREVAPWAAEPSAVSKVLAEAPAAAVELAELLAGLRGEGPPAGQVADATRPVSEQTARTPVEWLLARGLIVALDDRTVVMPREVSLALRGGRWLLDPRSDPVPVHVAGTRDPGQVDRAAGQQAHDVVRLVAELLEAWGVDPPGELRGGGLGVRDLTATSRALDLDPSRAAAIVEIARAAGLLASDHEESPSWLPTPEFDVWLARGRAEQWSALALAWLAMPRLPALVGHRNEKDSRINALSDDVERGAAPALRREVLAILATTPAGSVVDTAAVVDVLDDRLPRRGGSLREMVVESTLAEAGLLGVCGLGALSTAGRALLDTAPRERASAGTADPVAEAIRDLLPDPLQHVLLQADLTAVAPGPLDPGLARELALLADVESTGGATVYRFSEGSLRRALDTGRTAADVHDLLASRSRTPVPQPLSYLVDDVARRHGAIRVGSARGYIRCDDEATIGAILADRRAAPLRASRLAATVLAVRVPVDEALATLRDIGYAPMAESPDGAVLVRRPDARRSPSRPRHSRSAAAVSVPSPELVAAAVRALRAGDRATSAGRSGVDRDGGAPGGAGALPRTSVAVTVALLRDAAQEGRSVRIGYADLHGRAGERVVDPISVDRGFLTAFDHRAGAVSTFPVARITGAADLPDA